MPTESNDQIRRTHSFWVISPEELVGWPWVCPRSGELNRYQQDPFDIVEHWRSFYS